MITSALRFQCSRIAALLATGLVLKLGSAVAQTTPVWEAYNDYAPVPGTTSDFATGYELRLLDSGGPLRNIATGEDLSASVFVVLEGTDPDGFGANSPVNAGSPADKLFSGKVVIGNDGLPGVRASGGTKLSLVFSGLDPSRRYHFRGTVSRGGGYNDRWSVFTLSGATGFVAAHEDGSVNKNLITKATFPAAELEANQAALNSGDNKAGSLVGWNDIEPAPDGTFVIDAQQYVGPTPFGNAAAAPYGYGFNAIYLAEYTAAGDLRITSNPLSQRRPAGQTATFTVTATSSSPVSYQWERAAPGSDSFLAVAGATLASYTTPVLATTDSGARYRCALTSGGNQTATSEATLLVDGDLPLLLGVTASVNLNALYLNFSEPMDLDSLAATANYQIDGGLGVTTITVVDSTRVKLTTSPQTAGQAISVAVSGVKDIAGNAIAAGTQAVTAAFVVKTGAVGVEIWTSLLGSNVTDLTGDARYPLEPSLDFSTTALDSIPVVENGPLNTYGGRLRAWLTPAEDGDYEFFLHCDDTGELKLGTDDSFETLDGPDAFPIATDTVAGDGFQESGIDLSTSTPISLVRGQRYALQALWKESNGGDYCQVAWRRVGDPTPAAELQPISGNVLSYFGPSTTGPAPTISIARNGTSVVVTWTGGTLETSPNLRTWAPQTGAVSPLVIAPAGSTYYRVRP